MSNEMIPYEQNLPAQQGAAFDPKLLAYLAPDERLAIIQETARQKIEQIMRQQKTVTAIHQMNAIIGEAMLSAQQLQGLAAALRAQPLLDAEAQARYREVERALLDQHTEALRGIARTAYQNMQSWVSQTPLAKPPLPPLPPPRRHWWE